MQFDYYQHVRTAIYPLLPARATRILEIGSGAGYTLRWVKSLYPDAQTTAIEGFAEVEDQLAANADRAIIRDLEQGIPELGKFDLVLALDVLEHLRNPEKIVEQLATMMDEGATFIVSVPNVSHFSVTLPLMFQRRFDYADAGILDRTHYRLFVESSAVGLMNGGGFEVTEGLVDGLHSRSRLIDLLTLGLARHYLARQYIMKGVARRAPFSQGRSEWKVAVSRDPRSLQHPPSAT